MTFLVSALEHLLRGHTQAAVFNMPFDVWYHTDGASPIPKFIRKVEICTALTVGQNAWGDSVDKAHRHTLLRVFLASTPNGHNALEECLLIERVLSINGAYHSVTPISEPFSSGGTLFHPDVHDRVCVISGGASDRAIAHHLEIERTVVFDDGSPLALAQFAQILELVCRMTTLICAGGDCVFQSRSFAFTCMAALTPRLPPSAREVANDTMFELGAEMFVEQMLWLVKDPVTLQVVGLIRGVKGMD